MPKKIRKYPIYLAPNIVGVDESGIIKIYDEKEAINLKPNKTDDKIRIYERQVKNWFLEIGSKLLNEDNSGFIVLMIGISYIEGVQQYMNATSSKGNSKKLFKQGLIRIFKFSDEQENELDRFYSQVRCGLFHNGMSDSQVIISDDYVQSIDFSESNTIKINPKLFLSTIQNDFNEYILCLKDEDNSDLRDNFNKMFSVL